MPVRRKHPSIKPTTRSLLLIIINKVNWTKAIAGFTPVMVAIIALFQYLITEHNKKEEQTREKTAVVDSSWKQENRIFRSNVIRELKEIHTFDSLIMLKLK